MSWYTDFKTGTKDHLTSGKSKKSKSYSSYGKSSWWMDDWDYSAPVYSSYSTKELATKNLYKLAAHRRAIANFVSIVTGQSIPVKFSTKGDSYTDGKVVTISANIAEPKEFDPAVGLALHEGSHIKLSNFDILRDLEMVIIRIIGIEESKRLDEISNQKGVTYFAGVVKDILKIFKHQKEGNYQLPEDITTDEEDMVYDFPQLDSTFTIELIMGINDSVDTVDVDGEYYRDDDTIVVRIESNPNLDRETLEELHFELNELIAHELRHLKQHKSGLFDLNVEEPESPLEYYTQPHEIDSQYFGFKRLSRLTKKPFNKVVKNWFDTHKELHQLNNNEVEIVVDKILNYRK
jgi:hypothetical protein